MTLTVAKEVYSLNLPVCADDVRYSLVSPLERGSFNLTSCYSDLLPSYVVKSRAFPHFISVPMKCPSKPIRFEIYTQVGSPSLHFERKAEFVLLNYAYQKFLIRTPLHYCQETLATHADHKSPFHEFYVRSRYNFLIILNLSRTWLDLSADSQHYLDIRWVRPFFTHVAIWTETNP